MKRIARAILVALLVGFAGCGEAQQGHSHPTLVEETHLPPEPGGNVVQSRRSDPYEAEPRRVPKPKTCSEYANERQILLDEQAGRLTKADKQWLDMDGDGRYCEEPGVAWKGEQTQAQ
jgi:hypothetical protein